MAKAKVEIRDLNDIMATLSPVDKLKLNGKVSECADSFIRARAEAELRKNIADDVKDEFGMDKKDFNLLVSERFKDAVSEQLDRYEAVVDANDELINNARRTKGQEAPAGD